MTEADIEGQERLFRPDNSPPPRYKLAVINWISAYPLITLLLWIGQPLIRQVPVYVTTLVLSLTLVCLLTFIIMPIMMRLFSRWLQEK
ncbi:hypothetical protein [Leucobacter sp. GX24907]